MDIVYLTKGREQLFADTVAAVRAHAPWVQRYLAVSPNDPGVDGVIWVPEADLLSARDTDRAAQSDHGSLNALLRRRAIEWLEPSEPFLFSDDDFRPLRPIAQNDFIDGDKLHGYYSHHLSRWAFSNSSYDIQQHRVRALLEVAGGADHGYGAHQPQIIDPAVSSEAYAYCDRVAPEVAFEEWTVHHGLGRVIEPQRFHQPRPFRTLSWPQFPGEWPQQVAPDRYDWENVYPTHYAQRGVFAGLSQAGDPRRWEANLYAKLIRWQRLERELLSYALPTGVDVPWVDSTSRKAGWAALKYLRKGRRWWDYGELEAPPGE